MPQTKMPQTNFSGDKALCKYQNLFGKPGEGLHKYRIFNIAVVDVLVTFLLAWFMAWMIKRNTVLTVLIIFGLLVALSLIVHKLFCVQTTLTKLVFGSK